MDGRQHSDHPFVEQLLKQRTDEEMQDFIMDQFMRYDADQDGYLDRHEFKELLMDAELGLSKTPADILQAGHFQIPQSQEWETKMNAMFEEIKAGF